jgi:hypothetical protein
MYEVSSVIHVHSKYSDGSGEIPEIASYASEVGVDIVLMTDHNTLRPLKDGLEGWYGNTLVLIGTEINDQRNENHYLAFGISNTYDNRLPASEYVKRIKEEGGIGFVAHPFEKRSHMKEHPPYPWTAWESEDFTGIEVWNHMSEWMEGLTEQNKYQRFVHPLKSVSAPDPKALKIWDEIAMKRRVVGIGGVDAHAHKQNVLGFFEVEIFPYKVLFKSVRTIIICDKELKRDNSPSSIAENKTLVYRALRGGRCYIGNFYHADTKGFRFFAEAGDRIYQMGEAIPTTPKKARFRVNLPNVIGEINLVKNGEVIDSTIGSESIWEIVNHGIYRVEVYLDSNAWIFSNHIRFGSSQ